MRIAPLEPTEWDEAVGQGTAVMLPEDRSQPGATRAPRWPPSSTTPNSPGRSSRFNFYLLYGSTLPARLRELAILRIAHRRNCEYEWKHHVEIGSTAGLSADDIAGVTRGEGADEFDRTILAAVDELDDKSSMSDATWAALVRAPRQAPAHGPRLHDRLLPHAGHGIEHLWREPDVTGTGELIMPFFPKPDAGSWTENWPELGTAPVNYEDSIDPEHWLLEQQAIFKKTWLKVGRVEQLPKKGSYFTREMPSVGPGTSVIIVKDKEDVVRAFHNLCRHRGNKLVWSDYPGEEVSGTCRQFTCKYHAWRYALNGDLTFVQQEGEFFNLDKGDYGLVPVRCEVWEGFIFINYDDDAAPLTEYLGDFAKGLEGYPVPRDDRALQLPLGGRTRTGSCSSTRSPSSTTRRSCT